MQISRKKIFLCGVIFVLASKVFSQSPEIKMPEAPSMPEMPKIGGSFYHPTLPDRTSQQAQKKQAQNQNEVQEQTLSNGQTTEDYLSEMLRKNNLLSAQDISNLYDSGSFSTISSLLCGNTLTKTDTTDVLLRQVLNSLDDLKKEQTHSTDAEKEKFQSFQKDSETFKTRTPSVLRFKINGFDVADSLTKVFFSEPEPDGSFLFTADRRYFVNQRPRTESFYILFKSIKSNGSSTTYNLTTTLSQDEKNENSFIYRLSQQRALTAEKTGNLVVLHTNQGDFKMDLLLDIDSTK